jgi:hypothetical protein
MPDPESPLMRIGNSCFAACSLRSIRIPQAVEVVGKSSFQGTNVESIPFDVGALPNRIEDLGFAGAAVTEIGSPRSVELLGQLRLLEQRSGSCRLDRIQGWRESRSGVSRRVECVGKEYFQGPSGGAVAFEWGARITRIEDSSFAWCSLNEVCAPRSVEVLGMLAFAQAEIGRLLLEAKSRVARIEEPRVAGCSLNAVCAPQLAEEALLPGALCGHSRVGLG